MHGNFTFMSKRENLEPYERELASVHRMNMHSVQRVIGACCIHEHALSVAKVGSATFSKYKRVKHWHRYQVTTSDYWLVQS